MRVAALFKQRMFVIAGARSQTPEHAHHGVGVWPGGDDAVLGALQLRRRHHLVRPRDLLHVADGTNPPPDFLKVCHEAQDSGCGPALEERGAAWPLPRPRDIPARSLLDRCAARLAAFGLEAFFE